MGGPRQRLPGPCGKRPVESFPVTSAPCYPRNVEVSIVTKVPFPSESPGWSFLRSGNFMRIEGMKMNLGAELEMGSLCLRPLIE